MNTQPFYSNVGGLFLCSNVKTQLFLKKVTGFFAIVNKAPLLCIVQLIITHTKF